MCLKKFYVLLFLFLTACADDGYKLKDLTEAIRIGDYHLVEIIIDSKQVNLEPEPEPYKINKPLAYAVQVGNLDIIKLLIDRGADINGKVAYGDMPFTIAAQTFNQKQRFEIMKYLIEQGADMNTPNAFGINGFMGLCAMNKLELLKLVINKVEDVNAQFEAVSNDGTKLNYNALQFAVSGKHYDVVKFLLAHGADPSIKTADGKDSFLLAAEKGYKEIYNLMRGTEGEKRPVDVTKTIPQKLEK